MHLNFYVRCRTDMSVPILHSKLNIGTYVVDGLRDRDF